MESATFHKAGVSPLLKFSAHAKIATAYVLRSC